MEYDTKTRTLLPLPVLFPTLEAGYIIDAVTLPWV